MSTSEGIWRESFSASIVVKICDCIHKSSGIIWKLYTQSFKSHLQGCSLDALFVSIDSSIILLYHFIISF